MSPRVPGRNYYKQDSPSKRGYHNRGFNVSASELADLDADVLATGYGSAAAYLRSLWLDDRRRRGLPEPGKTTSQ